jgi:hypothetical protein
MVLSGSVARRQGAFRLGRPTAPAIVLVVLTFGEAGCSHARAPTAERAKSTRPSTQAAAGLARNSAEPSETPIPLDVDFEATSLRVRVLSLEPKLPTLIEFRTGGEGLGGEVRRGTFVSPRGEGPLEPGEWSTGLALKEILPKQDNHDQFFTITAGAAGRRSRQDRSTRVGYSTDVRFEVEILTGGGRARTLRADSRDGGTLTIAVAGTSKDGYTKGIQTARDVAANRWRDLRTLGWVGRRLPTQFAVATDLGGYGQGHGYGIRTADPVAPLLELQAAQELGINSLREAPDFVIEASAAKLGRLRARIIGPVGYPLPKKKANVANDAAGCAFGGDVESRSRRVVDETLAKAAGMNAESVWVLTQDEIGSVAAHADAGNSHFSMCDRCARGFRGWLKHRGIRPAELGARTLDALRPLDVWKGADRQWMRSREGRRLAYLSWGFLNVASASAFTELRDGFAKANEEKRLAMASGSENAAARRPFVYSYALRGNNFLSSGSNLDFFEFYRHADNAMVWETSNRDARVWSWDSYLTDVQRVLQRELGIRTGLYVKPHRGAPVQRMLSAVSRGDELIYWYTYGPDYWKGDAFSSDPAALRLTSKAAHLLGESEPYLYGTTAAHSPKVAVVRPETTQGWLNLTRRAEIVAASENGKWVYAALQHAHVPVEPLDETLVAQLDLQRYAAIYVSGTHVERRVALALERYVKAGGTLVTSGYGMAFDESDTPLTSFRQVLGLAKRQAPETGCEVRLYGAGQLQSLESCEGGHFVKAEGSDFSMPLKLAREALVPARGARVLASYDDGSVAVIENRYGKGRAIVFGYYAGLEYAAPVMRARFDMRRDFDTKRRELLVAPALAAGPVPVVVSDALVEPVLLQASAGGRWGLTLCNWAYADATNRPEWSGLSKHVRLLPIENLDVIVRGVAATKVRSAMLQQELPLEQRNGELRVVLPQLVDGDVLLFD